MEKNTVIPYVVENTGKGERSYDIYSRLLEDRIIFLTGEINDQVADAIVAQLIYLEGKDPDKDTASIQQPGRKRLRGAGDLRHHELYQERRLHHLHRAGGIHGGVSPLQRRKGQALRARKQRSDDPSAFGRRAGAASDIKIMADHILKTKRKLNEILAKNSGKPYEIVERDTDRDNYLSAEEAKEYGLVDQIFVKRP